MTTETNCPSHIEARERLAERLDEAALLIQSEEGNIDLVGLLNEAASALLATPTQGKTALAFVCPACGAAPGLDCLGQTGDQVRLVPPHPERIAKAAPTQGEDISLSRDHDPAIGSALERELAEHWHAFCDCDPVPEEFIERMESAGYAELRPVEDYDLEQSFAWERGIEAGGMVWDLTEKGEAALSSAEQVAGKVPGMQNNTSAAPTQEGVGREEIGLEHAAASLYDLFWARNGWANPVPFTIAPAAIRHMWRCIALDALSLLPAPKLGEGAATVQFVTSPQFEVVRRYAVICDMGGHKNVRCVVSLDERDPYSTADLADATRIAAEARDAGTANVRLIDACSGETLG